MSNCSDFLIKKEDHTIGNLLAEHLKQHPKVMMAGYKGKEMVGPLASLTYNLPLLPMIQADARGASQSPTLTCLSSSSASRLTAASPPRRPLSKFART